MQSEVHIPLEFLLKPVRQVVQTVLSVDEQSRQLGELQLKHFPLLGVATKGGEIQVAQRLELFGSQVKHGNLQVSN